jgi:hypothetical protein
MTIMDGSANAKIRADFTIPIGQVPYKSNITFHEEMVLVKINSAAKRGCGFMLFNMIEKLADEGALKAVKTGRTAFQIET